MILLSDLQEVVRQQKVRWQTMDLGINRDLLTELPDNLHNHALIISGIRRAGKSTLLSQFLKEKSADVFFLNFDTPKLYNFEITDFLLLDQLIDESKKRVLFFDELQVADGWELYARQKLDEGFRVFITGSNASLLSRELGTKLTGRHITKELFPFSYAEFCAFHELDNNEKSVEEYLNEGGFPEFQKTKNPEMLSFLVDDILHRDIAVRHNIRDVSSLKRLLSYLASNVGNLVTATKLTHSIGIKSSATVLEYFSFFEQSYLMQLMPKFSYSVKAQMINPRKIYFTDNGLVSAITTSFSRDVGRKLENAVYMHLRRKYKELFYYNEREKECDFVVVEKQKTIALYQVCYEINVENFDREKAGLLDAMNFFMLDFGTIITFNQRDKFIDNKKTVEIIPFHEWTEKA